MSLRVACPACVFIPLPNRQIMKKVQTSIFHPRAPTFTHFFIAAQKTLFYHSKISFQVARSFLLFVLDRIHVLYSVTP
jgi:hypothetical protein